MCGIAGIVHLQGQGAACPHTLARMARTLVHRGPDEEGFFVAGGVGLAARRLAIVGLEDGQQPVYNETRSIVAVFNGELFDFPETRHALAQKGHVVRSHSDSELVVHLWEQYGEEMFPHLRGQFAFALVDLPQKRMILARDRVGICPLYWSRQGDHLVFGSEIKALLASGLVQGSADPLGLDNIFTFFCMPGRRTAFRGVQAVRPGNYVRVDFGDDTTAPALAEKTYWDFQFPDRGQEDPESDPARLTATFDELLEGAVQRRLRADVPVAAYLSGGVDSSLVLAHCRRITGGGMSTFTARLGESELDESAAALDTSGQLGCATHIVECDRPKLARLFPKAVTAADCPVVDPNAGSLHALSAAVHEAGYKVVLTGEGADEALAGYIWFKAHRMIHTPWWGNKQPLVSAIRNIYQRHYPKAPPGEFARINAILGGLHAQTLVYHLTSAPKWLLLRDNFLRETLRETAYDQMEFEAGRIRRWHPLNQSLYMTYKTLLPGLLLNHRGDRASMANSVETRYPFLDEAFIDFCARIHPRWKLRGISGDKHLLRLAARQYLPRRLASRPKAMFRAPFASTLLDEGPAYVRQLLSPESLNKTDYFSCSAVVELAERVSAGKNPGPFRFSAEMSLCAVIGTQLWHHLFLGGGLCELPQWQPPNANG